MTTLPEQLGDIVQDLAVKLVLAVFYLAIGLVLSGWASRLIARSLDKLERWDQTLTPSIVRAVWVTGLSIVVFTILTTFGVQTTAILAVLSGAALAIGLAVQGTLSNVASGLMLLVLLPMRNNDYVDAGGAEGNVVEVNLFRTTIRTLSGALVSIPNSNIFGGKITNYSAVNSRSLWEQIGISYKADIDLARSTIQDILAADPRWFKEPTPMVYLTSLSDSAVVLTVSARCSTKVYFQAKSDFLEAIKKEFDQRGIGIPFPSRTIYMAPEGA